MLKKTLTTVIICLLFVSLLKAQKGINKVYVNLSPFAKGTTIPIQNKDGKTTLLISDEDKMHCILLNRELEVESSHLLMDDPRMLFKKKHIGNIAIGNIYKMFFYDKIINNVVRYSINYDSSSIAKKDTIQIMNKNETFLDAANMNDKVQLITADKKAAKVFVSSFDINGNIEKIAFSFPEVSNSDFKTIKDIFFTSKTDFNKISYGGNISLNTTQVKEKMYAFDDRITFTFDDEDLSYTFIISLNLITKQPELRKVPHPAVYFNNYGSIKNNSFIFEDKLYQVSSSYTEMKISIKDFNTTTLIKEYKVEPDKEISFKNGPIVQEGSYYGSGIRELSKSNQLIRKIANSTVAIAVNKESDSTVALTVGSYFIAKSGGGAPMMMGRGLGGIPIGAIGAFTVSVNPFSSPAMYNLGNNKMTKSAYFKSLLNKTDFSHVGGNPEKSAFDKINEYEDHLPSSKSTTVFALNDDYIYGYYNSDTKMYNFVRF